MYVTFGKRFLAVVFLFLLLFLCIYGRFCEATSTEICGNTNAFRVAFADSINCEIKEECISSKVTQIPSKFDETYKNYNEIQRKAGFDLEKYKGCKMTVYSYPVLKFRDFTAKDGAVLNLLVIDGKIVGGDVSSVAIDGKMYPVSKGNYG